MKLEVQQYGNDDAYTSHDKFSSDTSSSAMIEDDEAEQLEEEFGEKHQNHDGSMAPCGTMKCNDKFCPGRQTWEP